MNITLDDLRTFAEANSLTLDDTELQARLDAGSSNHSKKFNQVLLGYFPEVHPNDAIYS